MKTRKTRRVCFLLEHDPAGHARGHAFRKTGFNADRFAFDLTVSGALYGDRTVPRLRADGMVSAHNSCLRSSK